MLDLRARAEHYLGGPISPEEFERAEPYARRKLERINSREGTDHGGEYLAILVSEIVQSDRFSDYTLALSLQREIEKQVAENPICQACGKCGMRKDRPITETAPHISTIILPHARAKVKTEVQQ
ncbi:hypothetical protein [Clostridium sp. D33t1_170424_F3]|uniref:hypothetical protein n=1 Tax=Clostridium sp. D33t1_170424_F3 TaxID=2787099 RepID=UPI0018AAE55F|nr:hypothetical protein [Clostridium sp. D33t1_170424_F3]